MYNYSNVPRCHHIKVNGTRCGSPALRHQKLCFFHQRWHEQRINLRGYPNEQNFVEIPVLEDANSIQMALTQVMRMILSQKINQQEARLLLYALQIASSNLRHTRFELVDQKHVVIDPATLDSAGVGVDTWKSADFPNPLPAEPAPDTTFTPDPAQPVYVVDQKLPSPEPALIPDIRAEADQADLRGASTGGHDFCRAARNSCVEGHNFSPAAIHPCTGRHDFTRAAMHCAREGNDFSRAANYWQLAGFSRCGGHAGAIVHDGKKKARRSGL